MADLSPSKLGRILDLAAQRKARRGQAQRTHFSRKVLAMVFLDPSLRTRTSFEVAMFLHGGHGVVLEPAAPAGPGRRKRRRHGRLHRRASPKPPAY